MAMFPQKEGGIQVLAGLAPSSQTVGSVGNFLQKVELGKFTSIEK
jgi:hypothetical protein